MFLRKKYRISLLTLEYFHKWKKISGVIATAREWTLGWRALREEFFNEMHQNPAGVELPFLLGNISVKVLDREFGGCVDDFLKSGYRPSKGAERQFLPYVTADTVKTAKIVWKKHKQFSGLTAMFGLEASETMRDEMKLHIRGNVHRFEKVERYGRKKTKCNELPPEKGMFDD